MNRLIKHDWLIGHFKCDWCLVCLSVGGQPSPSRICAVMTSILSHLCHYHCAVRPVYLAILLLCCFLCSLCLLISQSTGSFSFCLQHSSESPLGNTCVRTFPACCFTAFVSPSLLLSEFFSWRAEEVTPLSSCSFAMNPALSGWCCSSDDSFVQLLVEFSTGSIQCAESGFPFKIPQLGS